MVHLFCKSKLLSVKLILTLVSAPLKTLADQSEFLSPNSSGTNSSIGARNWSNTSNIFNSNNNRTTCGAIIFGDITYYLTATNFGFAIPDDATIDGIVVEIEKSATGLLANVTDYAVRIIKGGSISGSNLAGSGTWPSSDAYSVYGGSSSDWGLSWTPADINNSNFGVAISANLGGVAVLPTARIDHIRISVYYTPPPLPVNLLYFKATHKNDHVLAEWATASQYNVKEYKVYSSHDGYDWKEAGNKPAGAPGTMIQVFDVKDYWEGEPPRYYRLTEKRLNSTEYVLAQVMVKRKEKKLTGMVCYPNPFRDEIAVAFEEPVSGRVELMLMDNGGRMVYYKLFEKLNAASGINIGPIPEGASEVHFLKVIRENETGIVLMMRENYK